jgi:hypothetical protein
LSPNRVCERYDVGSTNQNAVLYGFRVCANPVDWHTSLMATHTDFWCDANTHLFERFGGHTSHSKRPPKRR